MIYWPTVLDVIEAGIAGDTEKCRAYTQLLLEKLQEHGETRIASHVLSILAGDKGQSIHLAALVAATSDEKPYRVRCYVGTHLAHQECFCEKDIALSFARTMQGRWTNNVPDKQFHKFTRIVAEEHNKLILEISEGLHEVRKSMDE